MNVRLENIHTEASPANYVSFLSQPHRSNRRSDRDSIHSVSSVRSVMSGMSALWSNFGIGSSNSAAKSEKAKAQMLVDLKYVYSAFTKIPCLRLSPDRKAHLIRGYEEFPFDTAVPLLAFKNVSALEICDVDFRQFFGWDRLAEQLRSLTVKRGDVEDPTDLFTGIVLDDMDKRRRRSSKTRNSPVFAWPMSPSVRVNDPDHSHSAPGSPGADEKHSQSLSPQKPYLLRGDADTPPSPRMSRTKSTSPCRRAGSKQDVSYKHVRNTTGRMKRSSSGSSNSSTHSTGPYRTGSSSNLLAMGILPASKWRFLRHLSLADNSLTSMTYASLVPLANTLHSLDLSSNLFSEIPDCLATLTALRALNLSNCMIESLHSLAKNPLPAITALNLRANRLTSIAGVEKLLSLERLDLRENKIQDPTEMARLTGIPNIHEIWVVSNPLVKTHGYYRITIFNLFRSTAGYVEDVILDGISPSYSERRQLKDRAAESENIPVIQPVLTDMQPDVLPASQSTTDVGAETHAKSGHEEQHRPAPQTSQSEVIIGSNRNRKGARRRIVDLSREEYPQNFHQNDPSDTSNVTNIAKACESINGSPAQANMPSPPSVARMKPDRSIYQSLNPKKSYSSESVHETPMPSSQLHSFESARNRNGEGYCQKVEALKNDIGNNWLSILSEENWNEYRKSHTLGPDCGQTEVSRSEISDLRSSNPRIIHESRT